MDSFEQLQKLFTARVRDPKNNPLPNNISKNRMAVYESLLLNNITEILNSAFPVLYEILGENKWETLMREYLKNHIAHSPIFSKVPEEFLDFLNNNAQNDLPVFALELAHYEWMELMVDCSEIEIDLENIDTQGDFLQDIPVVSPLVFLQVYTYPVHKISLDYQPDLPTPTPVYITIFRNNRDKVKFMELNPLSAMLLQRCQENTTENGLCLLEALCKEVDFSDKNSFIKNGEDILTLFLEKHILLGTKK